MATGRQVSECPEARWELSDFLAFPCCYDSLKDFYDIYEVAALKWKVSAGVRPGRERAAGSEGDEAERQRGPALPSRDSSAPGLVSCTAGTPGAPAPTSARTHTT